MNNTNNILLVSIVLMSVYGTALLAAPASANYRLPWAVLDGGGHMAVSTNYRLAATFQSDASTANSTGYILVSGFLSPPDTDADSVRDFLDNCTQLANPDQRDTDGDHYGNRCDADLNNNGLVNTLDFGLFKQAFGSVANDIPSELDADFNGDGRVNTLDFGLFKQMFGTTPGPSGLMP